MTVVANSHILLDDQSVAYIEGTRTRVIMVVMDKLNGLTPEQIHAAYPYLSLSQIYAAMAYYYDHQKTLDLQMAQELKTIAAKRDEAVVSGAQPTRQELEARLRARGMNSCSLALYMDQHVRSEITDALRIRKIDVLTAFDDGHEAAQDPEVLQRATELKRVLFSQDSDLLVLASERQRKAIRFSGVIYAHQLGITIGQCVADLELICLACDAGELENRVIFLPL